tara:strand:+ start:46146 stop:46556 length:411 start_codon:yes stop_codon:yes gene_type:complete
MKDKYKQALMDMACRFGETSEATRLKVGSIIFKNNSCIALGVNGMPSGWPTEVCENEIGATKDEVIHSEDNALRKLWNSTETAEGAEIFISHQPCLDCCIKIATAKISKVYYRHKYRCDRGIEYLDSAGIPVERVE